MCVSVKIKSLNLCSEGKGEGRTEEAKKSTGRSVYRCVGANDEGPVDEQAAGRDHRVQGGVHGQHTGVLREGRGDVAGEEGTCGSREGSRL